MFKSVPKISRWNYTESARKLLLNTNKTMTSRTLTSLLHCSDRAIFVDLRQSDLRTYKNPNVCCFLIKILTLLIIEKKEKKTF